ncbi:MAG TPA: ABC transporter permease [Gemmatimonadales bacterium]|nr:ABC transporter permease [Gemmatimonadales bacterium]
MYVIYMLWLRQLKRYVRSRSRIVAALGQPVLYLVALGFGFGPVFRKAGEGDYIQFLTPGVVGMTVLFTAVFSGIELIWDRQFGFLKETLVAPVPRLIIMLGRTLGGATVAVAQGLLVLVICFAVGFRLPGPGAIAWASLYMTLIALMFTAFGTALASVLADFQGFQLVMNFLVMPIFFLSGALFPLADAPKALATVALLDPLAYGVDGLRHAVAGASYFGPLTDLAVLVGSSAALLALGSYLFSRIEL